MSVPKHKSPALERGTDILLHDRIDFVWRLPVNVIYAITILALLRASLMVNMNGDYEDTVRVH